MSTITSDAPKAAVKHPATRHHHRHHHHPAHHAAKPAVAAAAVVAEAPVAAHEAPVAAHEAPAAPVAPHAAAPHAAAAPAPHVSQHPISDAVDAYVEDHKLGEQYLSPEGRAHAHQAHSSGSLAGKIQTGLEVGDTIPLGGAAINTVTALGDAKLATGIGAHATALGAQAQAIGGQAAALGAQAKSIGAAAQAAGAAGHLQQAATLGAQAQSLGANATALGAHATAIGAHATALGARATAIGGHAMAAAGAAAAFSIVGGAVAVVDGGVDLYTGIKTVKTVKQLDQVADDTMHQLTVQGSATPEVKNDYQNVKTELKAEKKVGDEHIGVGAAKEVFGGMMIASPFTGPAAPIVAAVGAIGYGITSLVGHLFFHHKKPSDQVEAPKPAKVQKERKMNTHR